MESRRGTGAPQDQLNPPVSTTNSPSAAGDRDVQLLLNQIWRIAARDPEAGPEWGSCARARPPQAYFSDARGTLAPSARAFPRVAEATDRVGRLTYARPPNPIRSSVPAPEPILEQSGDFASQDPYTRTTQRPRLGKPTQQEGPAAHVRAIH